MVKGVVQIHTQGQKKGQPKGLETVGDIVISLVTSYTFTLRRIDQSKPKKILFKRLLLRENPSKLPVRAKIVLFLTYFYTSLMLVVIVIFIFLFDFILFCRF